MTIETPVRAGASSATPASDRFQTDIEGLRAVAILGVVAFHAGIPFITGGYAGVDVFFVISGYLISGLLLTEGLRTGRIEFGAFYARRARRILPSAAVVLVATAIAAVTLFSPLAAFRALQDLLYATVYAANWHFIALGTDYLAGGSTDSVVLHFWSLAVEEQFYLLWPLLILAAVLIARRASRGRTRIIVAVLALVTGASFCYSLIATRDDPSLAYMATTTRAWEFGAGALVATVAHVLRARAVMSPSFRVLGVVIGWAGAVAVVAGMFLFDANTAFPGTAALLPTLGTAAIIAGGVIGGVGGGSVGRLLSARPVRYIGRLSFTWYLWHWPALIFVAAVAGPLSWPEKVGVSVAALGLSVLTHAFVERPLMSLRVLRTRISSAAALGILATVISVATVLATGTVVAQQASSGTAQAAGSFASVFGADSGRHAGEVDPSPLKARTDVPQPVTCQLDRQVVAPAGCTVGDPRGTPVVLFGDSHANQWLPALTVIAGQRHWALHIMTKSGCPVQDLAPVSTASADNRFSHPDCIQWRSRTISTIVDRIKPSIVIVSSLSTYSTSAADAQKAWDASLDKLRVLRSPIVFIEDTPYPGDDIPECVSGSLDDWDACAFDLRDAHRIDPVPLAALRGAEPGVDVVDLNSLLCDGNRCPAVKNGTMLYRDGSHITVEASTLLAPALDAAMVKVGVVPQK